MAAMQSACKTVSSVKSVASNIHYCALDLAMASHPATRENRSYLCWRRARISCKLWRISRGTVRKWVNQWRMNCGLKISVALDD